MVISVWHRMYCFELMIEVGFNRGQKSGVYSFDRMKLRVSYLHRPRSEFERREWRRDFSKNLS